MIVSAVDLLQRKRRSERRRDPSRFGRKSLPLHGLREYRQVRPRGAKAMRAGTAVTA